MDKDTATLPAYRMSDAAKAAIAQTYSLMADRYCDLSVWDRHGRRTVERMALPPGATVLDAGCGAGASALPAAQAVGPDGYVIGVDLSDALLEKAQRRADELGLSNVVFQNKDMTALSYPDNYFDGVISAFSIFFVDDMRGLIAELWRMVKPGGTLAITTWAPPIFEPLDTLLRLCAAPELPHLRRGTSNMDRVMYPHLLQQMMREAGADGATAEAGYDCQELPTPDDWWTMVLGSGLRRIVASMEEPAAERVRARLSQWVQDNAAAYVATNVVYGIATKPLLQAEAGS